MLMMCAAVSAEGDALFGLKWLMSPKQVRAAGVEMTLVQGTKFLTAYKTDSLPKNYSMAEGYQLIFYKDSFLGKIIMSSVDITDDLYGSKGKEKFQIVYDQISAKNKLTNKFMYSGQELYKDRDEFYQCLKYKGCGSWIAFFDGDNKIIALELKPLERGEGYISIRAEAKPEWSNFLDQIKAQESSKDSESF
jgi:hypothetical protein